MSKQLSWILAGFLISCTVNESTDVPLVVPESLPDFEIVAGSSEAFDGYIFLREIKSPGAQIMIDSNGEIKWFQISDTIILRVFTPMIDRYVALFSKKEIFEITYKGDTVNHLRFGENGFDRDLHHEIIKDDQGNYLALSHEISGFDLTEVGGEARDTIRTDGIIKLSETGEKLWSWSLFDHKDPKDEPNILRMKKDWGHANSLTIDTDGNYLISWRDFDEVWKIDSESGEILWTFGGNEGDEFYSQHAIHVNNEGQYILFDNGDARDRKSTRAFAFTLAEDSFKKELEVYLPDSLFSFKQGSVYQVEDDRLLFSSTMTGTLIMTDLVGNVVWLAKSDHGFYRAHYLPSSVLK